MLILLCTLSGSSYKMACFFSIVFFDIHLGTWFYTVVDWMGADQLNASLVATVRKGGV